MSRSRGNVGRRSWSRGAVASGALALTLAGGLIVDAARGQAPPRPSAANAAPAPPPPRGRGSVAPSASGRPAAKATTPAPAAENPLAPAPEQVSDLTTRYRLIERYSTTPEKSDPADVGQYRIALREVHKLVSDNPQGAPDRKENSIQIIFTERPAVVNNSGIVTDTVRRYEAFRVNPLPPGAKPSDPRPLEGLTVWEKFRLGMTPFLMTLSAERPLGEVDASTNARIISMPEIAAALPALPRRIGEGWPLPKNAVIALLGDRPMDNTPLMGTLVDVHKAEKGPEMEAIIGVTGRVKMPPRKSDTLLNAQIVFTFTPPPQNADPAARAAGAIDARGRITTLRLAMSSIGAVPNSNGRLRQTFTREVTLQRPWNDLGAPLAVPEEPKPNPDNSWLKFVDAEDRFNFRHPQDLSYDPDNSTEDRLYFVRFGLSGLTEKVLELSVLPTTGKTETDRNNRDPEFHIKAFKEDRRNAGQEFLIGPNGWLPEADWSPYRLKVYRLEAALKLGNAAPREAQRLFHDFYLILTPRNETLTVNTTTPLDPPQAFREEVEQILRTIKFETKAAAPAGKPGG